MPVVTVFNQKGGVGKTTTCVNLAAGLARLERRPVAIDLDSQAHLTLSCGVRGVAGRDSIAGFFIEQRPLGELLRDGTAGLRVIPSHFELAKVDALFGRDKDIAGRLRTGLGAGLAQDGAPILIDCCPMLGVLTLNAVLAADRILIPVSADHLSLQGVERLEGALRALETKLGRSFPRRVVLTRFDSRRRLSYRIYEVLKRRFGEALCQTRITENVSLAESPGRGQDVFAYAPHSQGAKDYRALTEELAQEGFFG